MKLYFKFLPLVLPVAALLAMTGCQTKVVPVGAYAAPATSPSYSMVCNFESGANTNPNLFEIGVPGNVVQTAGTWGVVNNFPTLENCVMTLTGPGAAGTATAAHITGNLQDNGDGTYPSVALQGFLDLNSPFPHHAYNMSFFSGIKFYMNITPADTATARFFYIPTTQEAKSPQGDCTAPSGCYNYFGYTFTSTTNGWKQFSFDFSQLTTSYGVKPTPPTFTGVNLQQVIGLLWQEGRQNAAGNSNIDFWVDEVQYY